MSAEDVNQRGFHVADGFLSVPECEDLLSLIAAYRERHQVPEVFRPAKDRPLRYKVIDGEQIKRHLPEIFRTYQTVNELVNRLTGQRLVPLSDEKVGCNINIMTRGGTYRWHYDRNALTAILYLTEVEGGETEFYPNYRLLFSGARFSSLQRRLDHLLQNKYVRRLFGRRVVCRPRSGSLLLMRGDRCLHSVRPITGEGERINIIMSYDEPGADFAVAGRLDAYLYGQDAGPASDPNYL